MNGRNARTKRPKGIYVSMTNKDRSLNFTTCTESDVFHELTISALGPVDSQAHEPTASMCSSITSMVISVIGAGTLGIPYAVAQTGWVLAAILFVIVSLINMVSWHLIMECAKQVNQQFHELASYQSLCQRTVPRLRITLNLVLAATIFGVMCAYLVVIGDMLPDVVRTIDGDHGLPFLADRRFWISVMAIVFIFPLVRLKRMDSLRFTNIFAICCFMYMMVVVALYAVIPSFDPCPNTAYPTETDSIPEDRSVPSLGMVFQSAQSVSGCNGEIDKFPSGFKGIFNALPVYFMVFKNFNCCSVSNELVHCTTSRLAVINISSLAICMLIYGIVGFGGYWTFGNDIDNNILLKYPHSNSMLVLRIALSLAMVFGYPLQARACRSCLSSVLFGQSAMDKLGIWQFYGVTYGLVLASFGVAMSRFNLTHIMGIVGATGSPLIVFVLPGVFYYWFPFENTEHTRDCRKYIAMCFIIFGLVFIPFDLTMQFV